MPTDLDKLAAFQLATTPMSFSLSMKSAALVGETVNFASRTGEITAVAVTRKPAASAATVAGLNFTPDAPGLYQFTLTTNLGNVTAQVVCCPVAILGFNHGPRLEFSTFANGLIVTRGHLAGIAQQLDGRVDATTTAASIELAAPGASLGVDDRLVASGSFSGARTAETTMAIIGNRNERTNMNQSMTKKNSSALDQLRERRQALIAAGGDTNPMARMVEHAILLSGSDETEAERMLARIDGLGFSEEVARSAPRRP